MNIVNMLTQGVGKKVQITTTLEIPPQQKQPLLI